MMKQILRLKSNQSSNHLLISSLIYFAATVSISSGSIEKVGFSDGASSFPSIDQINEEIWKTVNDYDVKLIHMNTDKKSGYSKNNQ